MTLAELRAVQAADWSSLEAEATAAGIMAAWQAAVMAEGGCTSRAARVLLDRMLPAAMLADYREDQARFRRQELARREAERAAADLEDDEIAEVCPVEDEDTGGHA